MDQHGPAKHDDYIAAISRDTKAEHAELASLEDQFWATYPGGKPAEAS